MYTVDLTAGRLSSHMQKMRRERPTPVGLQPTKESLLTYITGAFPQRMRLTQPKDCGSPCIRKSEGTVADAPIFDEAMKERNLGKGSRWCRRRIFFPISSMNRMSTSQPKKVLHSASNTFTNTKIHLSESDKGLNDALLLSTALVLFKASVGSMASAGLKRTPWTPESS